MNTTLAEHLHYTEVAAALKAAKTRSELLLSSQRIQHVEPLADR